MADLCSKDEWSKDEWSKQEKAIAHQAYKAAFNRECATVLKEVQRMTGECDDPSSLWEIHDYLRKKLKKIEQKYDFRYSVIISVFARLICDGWLTKEDLAGIDEDKVQRIAEIAEFYKKMAKKYGNI